MYKLVCDVIAAAPDEVFVDIDMKSPYWALPMAIEHERIHIETSRQVLQHVPYKYMPRHRDLQILYDA